LRSDRSCRFRRLRQRRPLPHHSENPGAEAPFVPIQMKMKQEFTR
jgi:hypothetical protein